MQQRQGEGRRLARAGRGLADEVLAREQRRDRLALDRRRLLVAELGKRPDEAGVEPQRREARELPFSRPCQPFRFNLYVISRSLPSTFQSSWSLPARLVRSRPRRSSPTRPGSAFRLSRNVAMVLAAEASPAAKSDGPGRSGKVRRQPGTEQVPFDPEDQT